MELIGVALAVGAGVDVRRIGVLAAALYVPWLVLAGTVALAWGSRQTTDDRSVLFCESVASELRSGSPLGAALAAAATSVGSHVLTTLPIGLRPAEVANVVRSEFGDVGLELEATIKAAARTGGQSAELFDEIGSLAIAEAEIAREVRVASAPARATALVFVAAPVVFLFFQARSGSLAFLADPAQRIAGLAGLALFAVGLVTVVILMWRSA